ncbi:MAG: MBL fold metallo-hydrolase RNA specificity domain-containing protein [Thiohalomonadaceae bacterium]
MDKRTYQLVHHGGATGVTGSCHELRLSDGSGWLVDCGLFQGNETGNGNAASPEIDFPVDHIKAVIITHVHLDHVGRLPYLLAAGFDGPIYCSEPSAILLPLVLEDALEVGATRDKALIRRVLERIRAQLVPIPYGRWQALSGTVQPVKLRLKRAGHILGSAYVQFRLGEGSAAQTITFSGDLGAPWTPLLPAPEPCWGTDVLVLESTYGDRLHQGRRHRRLALKSAIERALANGGTVLIPAFSIGRTQELLYELEDIIHKSTAAQVVARGGVIAEDRNSGTRNPESEPQSVSAIQDPWPNIEIILDSPLASRFTAAYRQLQPYWDREARRRTRAGRHPLDFDQLTTVNSHEDHLRTVEYLSKTKRPAVVIAAGGMCAGGRIVNYLKAMLGDPRHDVIFVGYQAEGTPGRDIQKYGPRGGWVELDGQRIDIRAAVQTVSGYSAHADQQDLIRFVQRMRKKPSLVRLVHGDQQARAALAEALSRTIGSEIRLVA